MRSGENKSNLHHCSAELSAAFHLPPSKTPPSTSPAPPSHHHNHRPFQQTYNTIPQLSNEKTLSRVAGTKMCNQFFHRLFSHVFFPSSSSSVELGFCSPPLLLFFPVTSPRLQLHLHSAVRMTRMINFSVQSRRPESGQQTGEPCQVREDFVCLFSTTSRYYLALTLYTSCIIINLKIAPCVRFILRYQNVIIQ